MSGSTTGRRERLLDLLAVRATQPLVAGERAELDALLREFPDVSEDLYDLAAAALDCALVPPRAEPLPPELRARLEAEAHALFAGRSR